MNYVETVRVQWISCMVAVCVDRGKGLKVFTDSIPQCPACFTYVCLRAVEVWALVMVDDATFL